MKLEVFNIKGEKTGKTVELPDSVFGAQPNEHAVWLAVKAYLANQRQGTHKSKERSEMSGSTRKLHKQKGTGGARKGDINSPLLRGGGRVFGPRPRDYSQKLNKKVKRLARLSALSSKASNGQIIVLEDFSFDAPKTSAYLSVLKSLNLDGKKSLLVTNDYEKNVYLSSRNIQKAAVSRAQDLNTYEILHSNTLILSEGSIGKIVESL
ncbi:MAG: 50S ribosomal protein L4 [Saprospiraceae bacterium]|nr:50S ribosomal protein L4 [Saprospiraceae bacterium]MCF8251765.1 50S ribosomal protein L4 [Saprospiraceae bacterium]MCF8281251.1 50S ribosomal protein L4 [Bacteroidales bacterium]MCF8313407.1 50S ribosomal protein L4 [Saprospiraceae bacterium]MCF8442120.1 50S ribosomal protein L4 [Saprospiraceae bacterium]